MSISDYGPPNWSGQGFFGYYISQTTQPWRMAYSPPWEPAQGDNGARSSQNCVCLADSGKNLVSKFPLLAKVPGPYNIVEVPAWPHKLLSPTFDDPIVLFIALERAQKALNLLGGPGPQA